MSFAARNIATYSGDNSIIAVNDAIKSNIRLKKVYINVDWPSALVWIFRVNNDSLIYRLITEKSTAIVLVRDRDRCFFAGIGQAVYGMTGWTRYD